MRFFVDTLLKLIYFFVLYMMNKLAHTVGCLFIGELRLRNRVEILRNLHPYFLSPAGQWTLLVEKSYNLAVEKSLDETFYEHIYCLGAC